MACIRLAKIRVEVSGPTPPGTGVSAAAFGATLSAATSPTTLPSTTLIPASMTTWPGWTCSPVTRPGRPAATNTTSHGAIAAARSRVLV